MTDWSRFRFIDLFAGIGGIRLAFEHVGGECVFSSEWDESACDTYEANFGRRPAGDITKIDERTLPDFDVLLAGFPCQPFSIIGKKRGFKDETQGTLFFDIERILSEKEPPAFLLENVKNLTTHDGGRTFRVIQEHLKALGYHLHFKVLNSLDYGVPQKRERLVIVGFKEDLDFTFPDPVPKSQRITLAELLEPDEEISPSLYVRESIRDRRMRQMLAKTVTEPPRPYITHENISKSITPHSYSCALRAGASANYILVNNERRPSGRELLRLQGFPESYKIVVSYSAIRKQTGNSVTVPMIEAVAKKMMEAIRDDKKSNH
jgi:DNA (cytosine-5)-methyltransferase 1